MLSAYCLMHKASEPVMDGATRRPACTPGADAYNTPKCQAESPYYGFCGAPQGMHGFGVMPDLWPHSFTPLRLLPEASPTHDHGGGSVD